MECLVRVSVHDGTVSLSRDNVHDNLRQNL